MVELQVYCATFITPDLGQLIIAGHWMVPDHYLLVLIYYFVVTVADCQNYFFFVTVIYRSMDTSSGNHILVERLMCTQSCGNFNSRTGMKVEWFLVHD